jgi:outer membrane protein assembly factor BamB
MLAQLCLSWRPSRFVAGLAACLALLPLTVFAQTLPDWTVVHTGASGAALAIDTANQTLVAGTAAGPAMQVTKLNAAGSTLWQRNVGVVGSPARSTGIGTDASGNVLVTGYLVNTSGQAQGAVVAKLDAAGNVLWLDAASATFGSAQQALADAAGNVYVLGQRSTPNAAGTLVQEVTLTQYSAAGLRQWVRTWGANFAAARDAMVLTPAGQVVVAGYSQAGGDARIAAFDAAGNLLWATPLATSELPGLAVAANGDLAVVGGLGSDFLVARFNASFGPIWVRSYPARGYAMRAAFDAAGNLLVSGVSDTNTGTLAVILYSWMTLKLDPAGNLLWMHTLSASPLGGEVPAALAVGSDGAAYLTGQGRVPLATGGSVASTTTLKLAASGTQVWRADTSATNQSVGLKLGTDGGLRVLGNSPLWLARYLQSGLANQAPTALASANPSAGPAPLSVQFSAAGSTDPDGAIASYAWDFGDGQDLGRRQPDPCLRRGAVHGAADRDRCAGRQQRAGHGGRQCQCRGGGQAHRPEPGWPRRHRRQQHHGSGHGFQQRGCHGQPVQQQHRRGPRARNGGGACRRHQRHLHHHHAGCPARYLGDAQCSGQRCHGLSAAEGAKALGSGLAVTRPGRRQALRAEHGVCEPEVCDARRHRPPAHQGRAGLAHGGRSLDAVAALRGEPEKARRQRVEAADQIAIATKLRKPAQGRCGRRTASVVISWMRCTPMAMSSSSGCTSCGGTGSSLAGEPSKRPASGLMYQPWSSPMAIGHCCQPGVGGGSKRKALRRLGTRPMPGRPASAATVSHQAPAALMSTGAQACRPD